MSNICRLFSVIGYFNNTRTVVRHRQKILRDIKTVNVLSDIIPVQIRIEIFRSKWNVFEKHDNEVLFLSGISQCRTHQRVLFWWHIFLNYHLGGLISIYRYDELLLETVDRKIAPVRYFKFATDNPNGMNFYYNCTMHSTSSSSQTIVLQHTTLFIHSFVFILNLISF